MAIKEPVKTIDEAFTSSCKKNGLSIKKRKKSRNSMSVRDEENNIYIISNDFSFVKKIKRIFSEKKKNNSLLPKSPGFNVCDTPSVAAPRPKLRKLYGKKKPKETATELI